MNEIKEEMKENFEKMEELIRKNEFTIGNAYDYLKRYYNFYRKLEDLEESRNLCKKKYEDLLSCKYCILCPVHKSKGTKQILPTLNTTMDDENE